MDGILNRLTPTDYVPGSLTLDDLEAAIGNMFVKEKTNQDCKYIYHKTVGFPKDIVVPDRIFHLGYTNHARERARDRVKGFMVLPSIVRLTQENLIEIHTDDNKFIKKAVVKLHYDKKRDIVLVMEIRYPEKKAVVITLYYNKKNHSFETLDKTKFTKPDESCNALH